MTQRNITLMETREYGVLIESNPKALYGSLSNEKLFVSRDGYDPLAKHLGLNVSESYNETTHHVLLQDLLEFHEKRYHGGQTAFLPCRFIILETEAYLTKEAEFCILVYSCLLRTKSDLPRFYILFPCYVKHMVDLVDRLLQCTTMESPMVDHLGSPARVILCEHHMRPQGFYDFAKQAKRCMIMDTSGVNTDIFNLLKEDIKVSKGKPNQVIQVYNRGTDLLNDLPGFPEQATDLDTQLDSLIVCLDATIRIEVSSLYAGNRPIKKATAVAYLEGFIGAVKQRCPHAKVVVLLNNDMEAHGEEFIELVFRENNHREFTGDVSFFRKHMLDLYMLYASYATGDETLRSRISQAQGLIDKLGLLVPVSPLDRLASRLVSSGVHPMMAKLAGHWITMRRPIFPVLLFLACLKSTDKSTREVKEHGLKEVDEDFAVNCRLGETMNRAIEVIKRVGTIDCPEMGQLGITLKRLVVNLSSYTERSASGVEQPGVVVKVQTFDVNRFRQLLSELIRVHFPQEILVRVSGGAKTGSIDFRNGKHPQISWHIPNSPPFQEVFPLVSRLGKSGHRVILYLPM